MTLLFTILPYVPLICSVIVLGYCWRSSKVGFEIFGTHRFSFKRGTDQIRLGVIFSLMGVTSFIIMVFIPLIFGLYSFYLVVSLISLVEGVSLLIAGISLIIKGILIEKRND